MKYGESKMKYLFGTDRSKGTADNKADRQLYKIAELPPALADTLAQKNAALERAVRKNSLPIVLSAIKHFCLVIGLIFGASVLNARVTPAQGYRNAPWAYWIAGVCLLVGGLLWLIDRVKKKHLDEKAPVKEARKALRAAVRSADSYLSIPQDAKDTDILMLEYRQADKDEEPRILASLPVELRLFKRDGMLCITDGNAVHAIPCASMTGLRLVESSVPFLDWSKSDPPNREKYLRCGLKLQHGNPEALRYFCALEWENGGEVWQLAFPAWELPLFEELTGLKRPKLPVWSSEKKAEKPAYHRDGSVRPVFYWKLPKGENIASWFAPGSDAMFKLRHPKLYVLLVVIGLFVLLLPWFGFPLLELALIPGANHNAWTLLGLCGGFFVGVGLFNIIGAWLQQYLGHWVTILCLLLGGGMVAASWLLMI